MIAEYERRAAKLAALAAYADNSQERRKYLEEKEACEKMIHILQDIKTREEKNDLRKI